MYIELLLHQLKIKLKKHIHTIKGEHFKQNKQRNQFHLIKFPKGMKICKWKLEVRGWGSVAIVYDSINGEKAADGDSWRPI